MSNPIIYTMWSDILQHEKYKYYFLDTKSQWIHKFNQIINYIENNPIRASLVSDINEYRWSSSAFRGKSNLLLDSLFSL